MKIKLDKFGANLFQCSVKDCLDYNLTKNVAEIELGSRFYRSEPEIIQQENFHPNYEFVETIDLGFFGFMTKFRDKRNNHTIAFRPWLEKNDLRL